MKLTAVFAFIAPVIALAGNGRMTTPRDEKVSYDGYQVYRVPTTNAPPNQLARLRSFPSIDLKGSVEVAIPPSEVESLKSLGLLDDAQLLDDDLGRAIRAESEAEKKPGLTKRGELPDLSWFDSYHAYDDHVQYWRDLHAAFPDNSEWLDIGASYEGRNIFGLRLWGGEDTGTKPVVLWHSTVHAREWITTMVCEPVPGVFVSEVVDARKQTVEYLTYQLIDGYKSGDRNVTAFFDAYDFYIVPFHNPDGKSKAVLPSPCPNH